MSTGDDRTPAELLQALAQAESDLDVKRLEIAELAAELETTNRGILALHAELDDARLAEAHLASIVRSSDDAIVSAALDGTVSTWNTGAQSLLGYSEDEIVGRPAADLFLETSRADFEMSIKRLQSGDRVTPYRSWCKCRDGSAAEVSVTVSPMLDPEGVVIGFSVVISDMTEQRRAEEELAVARAEKDLLEDHERIARDLHDHVIQQLFASGMALQAILKLVPAGRVSERIRTVVDDLDNTITQIRTAIFGLHRRPEKKPSLRAQVLEIAEHTKGSLGFEPRVNFRGPIDTLIPDLVAEHLLAVLREALSNAARHANASSIEVHLHVDEEIILNVVDNGRGMGETNRRSGLANLSQRATLLGGSFVIASAQEGGTRLEWRVPIPRV